MKRATRPLQVKCEDCGQRIIVTLAKEGVCPACRIAHQGSIVDIRIRKTTTAGNDRITCPQSETG